MPNRPAYSCVLWDVDGTLVDASVGILRRLTVTLEHFGRPAPTRDELQHWIGPPMFESFQVSAGMTPEESATAVSYYRELGKADGYTKDVSLYPGVADIIADLDALGAAQATASSKPEVQVVALMEHFGLAEHMQALVGSTPDEKTLAAKADIVAEALRRLAAAGRDISRPVLVGDRHHDIDGAAANGIPVVFVRWGFSWPHEAEGAQAVVDTPEELRHVLVLDD